MKRRIAAFFVAAAFFSGLSGCSFAGANSGDLLAIPKIASVYEQLQEEIDKVLSPGGEFAAPGSGYRRQSVQLEDLDKDGEKEAIVFIRMPSAEKPLKLCLFKKQDGKYMLKASVEGEGSAFDSVYYSDVTGDGYSEIITGRSLGPGIPKAISVYSINDDGFYELMSNTYTGYCMSDLDNDGEDELTLIKHDPSAHTAAVAEVYKYGASDKAMMLSASVALSSGTDSILRIKTGFLTGIRPAIFISSQYNKTDIVTDICAYRGHRFVNITMDPNTSMSTEIVKQYTIFGTDINNDKVFDLPMVVTMPPYKSQKSTDTFRKIVWRNYNLYGHVKEVMQTYQNSSDGWYFVIPEKWCDRITVDRRDYVSGERTIVFSVYPEEGGDPVDVLAIYTLTGDNKEDRSSIPGRFRIITEQTQESRKDTVFAAYLAQLPPSMQQYALTEEEVVRAFKLIQTEWLTGELNA